MSVNLSLDEIIANSKAAKRSGGGGRGGERNERRGAGYKPRNAERQSGGGDREERGGRGFQGSFPTQDGGVPSGKWSHDLFDADAAPAPRRGASLSTASSSNALVRVNLSNLAASVNTKDLEELFADYSVDMATVHYGEGGQPLGTGDVTLKKRDATRLVADFAGISLDGKPLKMIVVDEGGASSGGTVFDRVQRAEPRRVSRGVQKRERSPPRRSGGGGGSHPLDRIDDSYGTGAPRRTGEGGGGGRQGGRGGRDRGDRNGRGGRAKMSEADLDAELDAYMTRK